MAKTAKGIDQVEKATEKLLDLFETGNLPAVVARTVLERRGNSDSPSAKWSLGNQVLMMIAGTSDARGFNQWKDAGRNVKKGSKAFYILAPRLLKRTIKNEETGEDEERRIVTGFFGVPVFRLEDTEGKAMDSPSYDPPDLPPLADVAKAYGVRVSYGPFTQRFYGYFRPTDNSIFLATHDVTVFFHELAHAVHHRLVPGGLKGGQHSDQEIVAETCAAVLSLMYGFEGYLWNCRSYIDRYSEGRGAVRGIMGVLSEVQKVLAAILDGASSGEQEHEEEQITAA